MLYFKKTENTNMVNLSLLTSNKFSVHARKSDVHC